MAGIGFNLQKVLEGDTFLDSVKAHFYSALICAGPWLLSIITLFSLGYFMPRNIDNYEIILFRAVIIYIFAFSLITVGIFHFPVTRYLADKLYSKEQEELIPVFNTTSLFVLVLQCVIGSAFFYMTEMPLNLKLLAILIYQTVSMLWLLMIFLTALRDYQAIVGAYLAGSLITVISSLALGRWLGLEGYFLGYLIGHLVIVILWAARIFIEFDSGGFFDQDFMGFLKQHRRLILIGFFYNTAIWIDKIVFWYSSNATEVTSHLRVFPPYDSAVFFAYLTIIPSLAIFLLRVETDFYKQYRRYYSAILEKDDYNSICQVRKNMTKQIRQSAGVLIRYQGILSLLIITFAPKFAELLGIPFVQIPIFRMAVVGAFLHSLLLMILILILYFDFQNLALMVSAVFLVTNGLFALITSNMELIYFGYGYLVASLVSLMVAYYSLDFMLGRLEFLTFASQPVGRHREEEIAQSEAEE
ncbi:MAG: exopolysaccharide Pel transporter PelG [Candidatus Omnitrophica bacterium]|nr:exopolysaccharide Pel transporter PelG [Candidatus Omnitrophota bacterium]MDD5671726.1 exopolysaccharide Pel transporter PelG [Candidatus Omnitrophota bacterium]